jgi:hypothetical protein
MKYNPDELRSSDKDSFLYSASVQFKNSVEIPIALRFFMVFLGSST